MINNAINFVMENSINPNLNNVNVINNQGLRNKINHAKIFIQNAKKVGDLYSYLMRSIANADNHEEMMEFNLIAFEDIIQEFEERFEYYLNDTLKEKTNKENKTTRMKSFLSVINKSEDMLNSWNERIWMLMVEKAIVQRDKNIKFIFYGNPI